MNWCPVNQTDRHDSGFFLQVRELLDGLSNVGVQGLAIRQDEHDIHELVACARLEQAVRGA